MTAHSARETVEPRAALAWPATAWRAPEQSPVPAGPRVAVALVWPAPEDSAVPAEPHDLAPTHR